MPSFVAGYLVSRCCSAAAGEASVYVKLQKVCMSCMSPGRVSCLGLPIEVLLRTCNHAHLKSNVLGKVASIASVVCVCHVCHRVAFPR